MDCPHLNAFSVRVPRILEPIICSVCRSEESPWLCINCGEVHCGRYINAHAKAHFEQSSHPLAVDCFSLDAFCYECDDFLSNAHRLPSKLFKTLNSKINGRRLGSNDGDDGDDSTNEDSSKSAPFNGTINVERKRGRKRNHSTIPKNQQQSHLKDHSSKRTSTYENYSSENSSESSDLKIGSSHEECSSKKRRYSEGHSESNCSKRAKENQVSSTIHLNNKTEGEHGIVGLRNLGNTCFMNSVLQSLSKIRGFSCYITQVSLPDQLFQIKDSTIRRRYATRSRKNFIGTNGRNHTRNVEVLGGGGRCPTEKEQKDQTLQLLSRDELLTNELRKILILLNTKGSSAVSPDSLFSIIWEVMPRFRGHQQQDAHEFLRYMLDQLHSELVRLIPCFSLDELGELLEQDIYLKNLKNSTPKTIRNGHFSETLMSVFGYNSIVTSMFGGILENEVRCSRCGNESRKNDPFLDLSLDIPVEGNGNGDPKLEDCLSSFTGVEELSDNDKYFCSHCKTHQKSTKRFSITRLPNVLCLHLKRFRFSNYLRTKLDHFVSFPMRELDMSNYLLDRVHQKKKTKESYLYDLAAVIVHHGTGVGSGHYTAFAKKDAEWYHFNDSNVRPSKESVVAKSKAYILFYTRSEFRLL